MPQIAQLAATYSSQIFWLLLTFGFVFLVVGLGMVPKVQSTVDARDKRIGDDLAAARAASSAADALEEKHRAEQAASRSAAQQLVADAKARAARENEVTLHEADDAIGAHLAEAEARIAAARQSAMVEIEAVAADAAADMVARVAGLTVSRDAATAAVKAVLTHG
jgi:F-type H+-transporting ATPase subunit b